MKTTRRKLLGLLGLGAAAAALGAGTAEAQASEQMLLDAVLATPEQYPEIVEKAREYQGNVGITPQWRQSIGNDVATGNYSTDMAFSSTSMVSSFGVVPTVIGDRWAPVELYDPQKHGTLDFQPYAWKAEVRHEGDTDLSKRCVTCGWQTPWTNEITAARVAADIDRMDAHMAQAHGSQQRTDTVWRPHEEA